MKIHFVLIKFCAKALSQILNEQLKATKVLEQLFKANKQLGKRDRGFIADTVYECLRWYRKYSYTVDIEIEKKKTEAEFIQIINIYLLENNWLDIEKVYNKDIYTNIKHRYEETENKIELKTSFPDWMIAKFKEANIAENELIALNKKAELIIRVNTLKINNKELEEILEKEKIIFEKINTTNVNIKNAYILKNKPNIFKTQFFSDGLIEVQDAGSQHISTFVDMPDYARIIDTCAGAGGKTLHLAALLKNKGKIVSMDIEEYKLEELKRRVKRAGVFNVEVSLINEKIIKKYNNWADILLIDAPCSGIGVLKRNPDAKWKLTPSYIDKIKETQKNILKNYTKMLQIGGTAIYATCSILPEENELQVEHFLNENKNFEFIKQENILPSMGFDGFYMCALKKIK